MQVSLQSSRRSPRFSNWGGRYKYVYPKDGAGEGKYHFTSVIRRFLPFYDERNKQEREGNLFELSIILRTLELYTRHQWGIVLIQSEKRLRPFTHLSVSLSRVVCSLVRLSRNKQAAVSNAAWCWDWCDSVFHPDMNDLDQGDNMQ